MSQQPNDPRQPHPQQPYGYPPQGQPGSPQPPGSPPYPPQPYLPYPPQPYPRQPQPPHAAHPAPAKHGRGTVWWIVGLVATAIVFGSCGIGIGAAGSGDTAAGPAPTVTVTETIQAGSDPAADDQGAGDEAAADEPAAEEPEPAAGDVAFGDGQHIVGADIAPGRYRTLEEASGGLGLCYVDIQNDAGDYLAQELVDSGRTILDVPDAPGAILSSSGCGDWERVDG